MYLGFDEEVPKNIFNQYMLLKFHFTCVMNNATVRTNSNSQNLVAIFHHLLLTQQYLSFLFHFFI